VLRSIRRLADGSYLAKVYPSETDRRHDTRGLAVRVVEYTHDDPNRPGAGERHRLITDLTNPEDMPAREAPLVYHERWEQELAFDEIKTHLSGRAVPIRSKAPAGVVQEVYGLVLAHWGHPRTSSTLFGKLVTESIGLSRRVSPCRSRKSINASAPTASARNTTPTKRSTSR
jgi:hypothetical protein